MPPSGLSEPIERIDVRITSALAPMAVPTVRIALGIVFVWFARGRQDRNAGTVR